MADTFEALFQNELLQEEPEEDLPQEEDGTRQEPAAPEEEQAEH